MKRIIQITYTVFFLCVAYSNAQDIPNDLKEVYQAKHSKKHSDEFNGNRKNNSFNTKKWHYRQPKPWRKGLAVGQEFVEEKDGKLICYGRKDKKKAGGIVF